MQTARELLKTLVLELQDGDPFAPSGAMEMAVKYLEEPYDEKEALIRQLMEKYGLVRYLFFKDDIQDWATERYRPLTEEELEKVAYSLSRTDPEYGLNWQAVDDTITNILDSDELP